eukprot:scaffold97497_cov31-Phaeocystis_antarctica.AAC.2
MQVLEGHTDVSSLSPLYRCSRGTRTRSSQRPSTTRATRSSPAPRTTPAASGSAEIQVTRSARDLKGELRSESESRRDLERSGGVGASREARDCL